MDPWFGVLYNDDSGGDRRSRSEATVNVRKKCWIWKSGYLDASGRGDDIRRVEDDDGVDLATGQTSNSGIPEG